MSDYEEQDLFDLNLALPPLSREREHELFAQRRVATPAKRKEIDDLIVRSNISFAAREAHSWSSRAPFKPLRRAAVRGLVYAIQRYDETRGLKFISYAVWWIHDTMRKEIAQRRELVKPPSIVQDYMKAYMKKSEDKNLTQEEVFDLIGCYGQDRIDLKSILDGHLYIDTNSSEQVGRPLVEKISLDVGQEDPDLWVSCLDNPPKTIDKAMAILTDKEQYVVVHYYGLRNQNPSTLDQISKSLHCSRERVRQVKKHAEYRLRCELVRTATSELYHEIRKARSCREHS